MKEQTGREGKQLQKLKTGEDMPKTDWTEEDNNRTLELDRPIREDKIILRLDLREAKVETGMDVKKEQQEVMETEQYSSKNAAHFERKWN